MSYRDIRKEIEVLGVGTAKDRALLISTDCAAKELGIPVHIVLVSSLDRFLEAGICAIPALIVEGQVVSEGRLPAMTEIMDMLQQPKAQRA